MENTEQDRQQPEGTEGKRTYGEYRKLGQPADTVSGATQELFEVRPSGASAGKGGNAAGFKIIAVIAIILLVGAIIAVQSGNLS